MRKSNNKICGEEPSKLSRGNPPGRSSANQRFGPRGAINRRETLRRRLRPGRTRQKPRRPGPRGTKTLHLVPAAQAAQTRPGSALAGRRPAPSHVTRPALRERSGRQTALVCARRCLAGRGARSRPGTSRVRVRRAGTPFVFTLD